MNTGPAERVEVEFDARVAPYVRARVWHASQQISDANDGGLRLTLNVCHDWALRSWLLGWGAFARVGLPGRTCGRHQIRSSIGCRPVRASIAERRFTHMTRTGRIAAALVVVLLFLAGPSPLRFYTDWLWFGEVGYQHVYLTMLRTQGTLFTTAFVIAVGWFLLNLRVALSSVGNLQPVFTTREGIEVTLPSGKQLRGIATAAATLLAIIIGLYAAGRWELWLTWRHGVPFSTFLIPSSGATSASTWYSLPFLQLLRGLGQALVVLAALTAGGLYLVSGSLSSGFPGRMSMTPSARRHLSLLVAAFLLLLAWGAWLQRPELLVQPSGLLHGASYADVFGRMPAAFVQVIAGVIGAGLAYCTRSDPGTGPSPPRSDCMWSCRSPAAATPTCSSDSR